MVCRRILLLNAAAAKLFEEDQAATTLENQAITIDQW
jgi:hypothetical protein